MGIGQMDIVKDIQVINNGKITAPEGYYAGGLHCGIKRKRPDLAWLYSEVPADAAAVYTTNVFQAAPLKVTKESIKTDRKIQAVIVNSGNANACTGEEGYKNALRMRAAFADHLNINEDLVAVSSTGVIGEQLPMDKILHGIDQISPDERNPDLFEKAILTTDTTQKSAGVQLEIDGKPVTIAGAAKGSGMIEPNMATMLAFITTDAKVGGEALQTALKTVTDKTFNMITVDGDTSTNDMVLLMANGLAGNNELSAGHPEWHKFLNGLEIVCQKLAKDIARDGEGATKLISVHVRGAASNRDAKKIAKAIVGSNLVKTAVFGKDPNWGRIICAIGYSGIETAPAGLNLTIGPWQVLSNGSPVNFDENAASQYFEENSEVEIFADLNSGNGKAMAWGCDLTYEYVKINSLYRT